MSNTLTSVAPVLYSAARMVPRELTGLLGAVKLDFSDKGVAKGDTVKIGVSPVLTAASVTPAQTFTAGSDRTFTSTTLTLNNFKEVSWNLTAEEERSLMNSTIAQDLLAQTVQQGIRTLVNTIELSVWNTARVATSRAFGTAATAPFATTIGDLASTRKIIVDNGGPSNDLSLVVDTAAGVNLRSLANLYKANEAGGSDLLRAGILGQLYGIDLRESGQITTATKGTGASYTSDTTGYAIGSTSITLITGTGTVLAGDSVTFTGDTNRYVVKTGVAAPGVLVLAEPGLRIALAASAVAMTVGATATQNLLIHRNHTVAVVRPALQPDGALAEQMVISDDQTGLSFLMLRVPGSAMSSWYMRVVYDSFSPNPFAGATLLG